MKSVIHICVSCNPIFPFFNIYSLITADINDYVEVSTKGKSPESECNLMGRWWGSWWGECSYLNHSEWTIHHVTYWISETNSDPKRPCLRMKQTETSEDQLEESEDELVTDDPQNMLKKIHVCKWRMCFNHGLKRGKGEWKWGWGDADDDVITVMMMMIQVFMQNAWFICGNA